MQNVWFFLPCVSDNWFSVDEKPPIAYARVEILEGADMKPSDPNGMCIEKMLRIRNELLLNLCGGFQTYI